MAGTEVGSLYYDLNIDDKNLKRQLDGADRAVKSLGSRVNAYWGHSVDASRKFALGLGAVTAGVVAFGVSSVKSFQESQNVMAQTNAVLKSTGKVAGVTADQVTKLASALERQTKFADEDIQSAENLLLTFTSINKKVFPQATKIVLDMSAALGQDLKSSAIQVGKALQDPVLGVTALRRVGVNFSKDQQEVIAKLVETGQKAKAQQLILKELNTEFGGSAVAAGNTFAGALAKLSNQFDNVKEAIGGMLAAVAAPLIQNLLDWFDRVGGVNGVLGILKKRLDLIKPYIPQIAGAIVGILVPAFVAAAGAAALFLTRLAPWAVVGSIAVTILKDMGVKWEDINNVIKKSVPIFGTAWRALFQIDDIAKSLWQKLQALWKAFTQLTIIIILGQYFMQVLWPALSAVGAALWQNLLPALKQMWDAVVRLWNALNPALTVALKIVGAVILGVLLLAIWAAISVLNIIIKVFAGVVSAISNVIKWISNLIAWFGNLMGAAKNVIRAVIIIFANLTPAIRDVLGVIVGLFGALGGRILRALGGLGMLLYNAGKDLIQGMINGITDKFKDLAGAVKKAVGKAVGAVKSFLGIHSPSKVFHEIGKNVTQGFVNGITANTDKAMRAMNTLGNAVISPTVMASPSAAASTAGNSYRYGDIHVSIGQVNNQQDVDYLMEKINRSQRYQIRGGSPKL